MPPVTVRGRFQDGAGRPLAGLTINADPAYDEGGIGRVAGSLVVPRPTSATTDDNGELELELWPSSDWLPAGVVYHISRRIETLAGGRPVGVRVRSVTVRILDEDGLWLHDPRLHLDGDPDELDPDELDQ